MIDIEIVYAKEDQQPLIALKIPEGTTVEHAIAISGILQRFPEINLTQQKIGVFGKIVSLSTPLYSNDRIEIYRPLKIDPKQARRLRAKRAV